MPSKRYKKLPEKTKELKSDTIENLLPIIKKNCTTKFDESIDINLQINNKQKKNEINLRSVVNMPAGSGKKVSVAVVCEADKQKIAEDAGADIYGGDDFIEKIKNGEMLIVETCNNLKAKDLRSIVDQCKSQFLKNGVIIVGAINEGKISFLVGVTNELSNNLSASDIALYAAKITNGKGGGGRKDFAQSGGIYSEEINIKESLQKFLKENIPN